MNTKTMRLPPRRVLTPVKRKERDGAAVKPPGATVTKISADPGTAQAQFGSHKAAEGAKPVAPNFLMAGYLAHEFLTKGTLLGEPWDLARVQATPKAEQRKSNYNKPSERAEPDTEPSEREDFKRRRYVEVAQLVRADGTHLPGIVNPSQLARFLKL